MTRWLRKYGTILSICLIERLTYRTDFFLGTLMRFLPIVTTIFLWSAIFAGSHQQRIAGLTANGIVAYYLLTMVGRAFSSMPGLATGIAADIRGGHIKKYLTQPVNLLGFLLCSRVAHKLVYYGVAFVPYALVFWLCRAYFPGWPSAGVMTVFLLSLVIGFLIGFLIEALIGLLGFWLLEISSFSYAFMTIVYVLSGHMFPLDLAPEPWATLFKCLPFQYLAYFPAKLFLSGSEMTANELLLAFGQELVVTLLLALLVVWVYRRGLRHYSAFGG